MSAPSPVPNNQGRFGAYGGRYVPETLLFALRQLGEQYEQARSDPAFRQEFDHYLHHYVGRPSLLYHAERLTREAGGARIFLKREDLNHTGAHKINNCIGQALLARRLGKPRVIAETGAGQHGVAAATVAARFGMECVVYMGSEDVKRQAQNVFRMKLLGAEVVPVEFAARGPFGRTAWQPHLSTPERRRPDRRDAFSVGRARLSGRRTRARLAQGQRARELRRGDRRRCSRRVQRVLSYRGDHPGA